MSVNILQGDCLETLKTLPDCSVQCVITSPPYYGLRSYIDSDSPDKPLEIGLEETPEAYVEKLVQVFREVRRVLKDDGTLWLNLGDTYASAWASGRRNVIGNGSRDNRIDRCTGTSLKEKDLIGIPWAVAFALRADGWWLRSDIIWAKPNPMPESVRDRPTKSHEYIFLLTKSAKYYYDADAIAEPTVCNDPREIQSGLIRGRLYGYDSKENQLRPFRKNDGENTGGNGSAIRNHKGNSLNRPDGKRNKRDVWTITTKSYKAAHFATYPPDLIEPCILAGSDELECSKCGKPYRTAAKSKKYRNRPMSRKLLERWERRFGNLHQGDLLPQTVLDPFSGSGTTGEVSIKHNRNYIGCELNPEYIELTNRRLARVQPFLI